MMGKNVRFSLGGNCRVQAENLERYGKIMTGWWCNFTIEIVDLPIKNSDFP